MGLFTKKEYKDDPEPPSSLDPESELQSLREQLHNIKISISESEAQLQSVRDEYTAAISDIMKIKKEINSKRETRRKLTMQNRNIEMQIEQGRKILQSGHKDIDLLEKTAADLSLLEADMESKKAEYANIQSQIKAARDELDAVKSDLHRRQTQSKLLNQELARLTKDLDRSRAHIPQDGAPDAIKNLAVYKSRLVEANAESQKLRIDLESSAAMIQELRQKLKSAEAQKSDDSIQQSNRKIVEAASSLVASFKRKLATAQDELAQAHRTSDALRRELADVKRENASLKSSRL